MYYVSAYIRAVNIRVCFDLNMQIALDWARSLEKNSWWNKSENQNCFIYFVQEIHSAKGLMFSFALWNQQPQHPPSIGIECPLINDDLSLSKNIIGSLTSFNSAKRCNGILHFIFSALVGSLQFGMLILVRTTVGLTLFTRIWRGPSSRAKERVNASTAAFEAE